MRKISDLALALGLGIVAASPSDAHHATTAFDYSKVLTVQATVKRLEWTSPHTHIIVIPENQSGDLRLEVGTVSINARDGWSAHVVSPGEKVVLTYSPMKDGSAGGTVRTAKLPNGQILRGAADYLGSAGLGGGPSPQSDNSGAAVTSPGVRP